MTANRELHFETLTLHAGHTPDKDTRSRAVPIYQTSSYVFDSAEHGARLFNLEEPGNIYTRIMNPTQAVLEERVAKLEGGVGGPGRGLGPGGHHAWPSPPSCEGGDHIVAGRQPLRRHLQPAEEHPAAHWASAPPSWTAAIPRPSRPPSRRRPGPSTSRPSATPSWTSPTSRPSAAIAEEAGVPLIVDNTLASPLPAAAPEARRAHRGAQRSRSSSAATAPPSAGILVDGGRFDWANGKYPEFTEPNPSYHGAKLVEVAGPAAFVAKARLEILRDLGAGHLALQRLPPHPGHWRPCTCASSATAQNALALAQWLEQHPKVAWVNYPGLPTHPSHATAKQYFRPGRRLRRHPHLRREGRPRGRQGRHQRVELFSRLANVGDAKSLIIHPASTTHQQLSAEERTAHGRHRRPDPALRGARAHRRPEGGSRTGPGGGLTGAPQRRGGKGSDAEESGVPGPLFSAASSSSCLGPVL